MMTIKKMLLAGLVLLGLSACSNDDSDFIDNNEKGVYDTYLSVTFSAPKSLTRAPESETVEDTAEESKISEIMIYLTQGGVVKHAVGSPVTSVSSSSFKTEEPVEVPVGSYNVYVVVNPDNSLTPARQVGEPINSIIEGIKKSNAEGGLKDGKFLMATASSSVNMSSNGGAPVIIDSSNDKSKPASVSAAVDRAAVKIVDNSKSENIELKGDLASIKDNKKDPFFNKGDFKVEGYAIVNGNQKINLIQQWTEGSGDVTGTYINTPKGAIVGTAMTGYYSPFTEFAEVLKSQDNSKVAEIKDLTVDKTDVFTSGTKFTVENLPPFVSAKKLTAGMAQTTGVIYKMTVKDGKTFYYVGGVIYQDIADVKALDQFKDIETFPTEAAKLRALGIRVYENGVMYYTYFIRDLNNKLTYKQSSEAEAFYGLYRNSVYNLGINSISAIGDDVPGGGKVTPDTPNPTIDPDEVFLHVTVTINPWVLNNIGIEF